MRGLTKKLPLTETGPFESRVPLTVWLGVGFKVTEETQTLANRRDLRTWSHHDIKETAEQLNNNSKLQNLKSFKKNQVSAGEFAVG